MRKKNSECEHHNIYFWQPMLFCCSLQGVSEQSTWVSLKWRYKWPFLCLSPCPPVVFWFTVLFLLLLLLSVLISSTLSLLTLPAKGEAAKIANPPCICSFSYWFCTEPWSKAHHNPGGFFPCASTGLRSSWVWRVFFQCASLSRLPHLFPTRACHGY